ncbi:MULTISPECIES: PadR family transcriptional regulator [Asticcacaulis]|uniref:PadR family transcriptional regulator n=1 Tax=Asticcacaulis TaxID=76890 RepID=UPI001AE3DE0C|nr:MULTISPECIES: PadR family transcriptional regulator [Asticcacaulis]MBP2161310.1 DNA-binding PadR family transcriptional regulator [Asticcacaulis solisilvae]MDR6802324.1 DNA-binding PadR family transcriptional regulator [Asticcacaulis sp. BE141]
MTGDLTASQQHAMLAMRWLGRDAYGISIRDKIRELAGIDYSTGSIYAILEKLEKDGYLRTREGEATAERGGRRKTYYEPTAQGQAALTRALAQIDALRGGAFPDGVLT